MKQKSIFVCGECGYETPRWMGRCPQCGSWNTIVEEERVSLKAPAAPGKAVPLKEVSALAGKRTSTGVGELDRVLGGGAVKGALVLLGGAPGIGKSTLMLQICEQLNLPQMCANNGDNHLTAFTISIDHISTTTGISAVERGITARATVADGVKPTDFRRPGHMFPLQARDGGVLVRTGHTEATVDLCRLAGLKECGLCCEIMREDGTMMRTAELMEFGKKHNLVKITIADLVAYRRHTEKLVKQVSVAELPTKYGTFRAYGYVNEVSCFGPCLSH